MALVVIAKPSVAGPHNSHHHRALKSVWQFGPEVNLHIGVENPFERGDLEDIDWIQVDGDELEYLERNWSGLCYPKNKRVVKFYNETAKMIVGNF